MEGAPQSYRNDIPWAGVMYRYSDDSYERLDDFCLAWFVKFHEEADANAKFVIRSGMDLFVKRVMGVIRSNGMGLKCVMGVVLYVFQLCYGIGHREAILGVDMMHEALADELTLSDYSVNCATRIARYFEGDQKIADVRVLVRDVPAELLRRSPDTWGKIRLSESVIARSDNYGPGGAGELVGSMVPGAENGWKRVAMYVNLGLVGVSRWFVTACDAMLVAFATHDRNMDAWMNCGCLLSLFHADAIQRTRLEGIGLVVNWGGYDRCVNNLGSICDAHYLRMRIAISNKQPLALCMTRPIEPLTMARSVGGITPAMGRYTFKVTYDLQGQVLTYFLDGVHAVYRLDDDEVGLADVRQSSSAERQVTTLRYRDVEIEIEPSPRRQTPAFSLEQFAQRASGSSIRELEQEEAVSLARESAVGDLGDDSDSPLPRSKSRTERAREYIDVDAMSSSSTSSSSSEDDDGRVSVPPDEWVFRGLPGRQLRLDNALRSSSPPEGVVDIEPLPGENEYDIRNRTKPKGKPGRKPKPKNGAGGGAAVAGGREMSPFLAVFPTGEVAPEDQLDRLVQRRLLARQREQEQARLRRNALNAAVDAILFGSATPPPETQKSSTSRKRKER